MLEPVLPADPFAAGGPVRPEHIPACPGCGGGLRPWGVWRARGGQLADCRACRTFHGVVLLPTVRYAMVDATDGVWHSSAHPLPAAAQLDAVALIAGRDSAPDPARRALRSGHGDAPLTMIGDWCRIILSLHWQQPAPPDESLAFLLAFREEDLVIEAAAPIPAGGSGTENPDQDLAPGAFRLRCGSSLIERMARSHPP